MNIQKLINAAQKPSIYTQGTANMWVDPYISKQLLKTHLSQDVDLASRKEATIVSTIEWILDKVPGEELNILDIGCGPGLYTEKLRQRGHQVTGMDFSANSIAYARASAAKQNLDIEYLHQDYLALNEENKYDLIMMIFTDFGVLTPDQRNSLLKGVHGALKPGGIFLFDVLNENYPVDDSESKQWELSEKGFWRDRPYLALTASYYYENQKVQLNQHVIMEDTGKVEVYRFWIHTFSHKDLCRITSSAGFSSAACYDDVIPDADIYRSEDVTFCVAKK